MEEAERQCFMSFTSVVRSSCVGAFVECFFGLLKKNYFFLQNMEMKKRLWSAPISNVCGKSI